MRQIDDDNVILDYVDYGDYVQAKKKVGFNIDSNHRCRLQCPACQRQKSTTRYKIKISRDMPFDDWRKLLTFADPMLKKWNFFNFAKLCGQISDPIYHPNFLDLLKIRNKEFPLIPMEINTNGSGKKPEWWDQAFELSSKGPIERDKWIFALDGTDNYTNDIYRVNSNFDEVYEVLKKGKEYNLEIWWFFLIFEHNQHQLETARKMAKDLKIGFREEYTTRTGGTIVPAPREGIIFNEIIDRGKQLYMRPVDWKFQKLKKHQEWLQSKIEK
jgi:MoaA/NifB/PqqE/SkfB family radical SAM enzyme